MARQNSIVVCDLIHPPCCARAANLGHIRGQCEENNIRQDPERRGYAGTRAMPMRRSAPGDRFSGTLGLARSFGSEPACAWRGLRNLCRQLAEALSHHPGKGQRHAIRRRGRRDDAQLLRSMRHSDCLRTIPFTPYGERAASAVQNADRPASSISHRNRRDAGVGVPRRAVVTPERLSRCGMGSIEAQTTRNADIPSSSLGRPHPAPRPRCPASPRHQSLPGARPKSRLPTRRWTGPNSRVRWPG